MITRSPHVTGWYVWLITDHINIHLLLVCWHSLPRGILWYKAFEPKLNFQQMFNALDWLMKISISVYYSFDGIYQTWVLSNAKPSGICSSLRLLLFKGTIHVLSIWIPLNDLSYLNLNRYAFLHMIGALLWCYLWSGLITLVIFIVTQWKETCMLVSVLQWPLRHHLIKLNFSF